MIFKLNGHWHFYGCIKSVKKVRPGLYQVESTKGSFQVEGGKHAGGSRRDWFLDGFGDRAINCTSLVDALNCIENA